MRQIAAAGYRAANDSAGSQATEDSGWGAEGGQRHNLIVQLGK